MNSETAIFEDNVTDAVSSAYVLVDGWQHFHVPVTTIPEPEVAPFAEEQLAC